MMEKNHLNLYDRINSWLLPAIMGLTPLVVIYALPRPNTGQAFFFMICVLAATLSLGLAWIMGWRPLPGRITIPAGLIALIGLSFVGSLMASQNMLFSVKMGMLPFCGFLFFGLVVLSPQRRLILERSRLVLIVVATLLAVYGILQQFGYEFLRYSSQIEKNKVIATLGHPNYLASALGPILFIALSFVFAQKKLLGKLLGGLAIFTILFCITLARTRGVWLGLFLGLLFFFVIGTRYCILHKAGLRWISAVFLGSLLMVIALSTALFVVLPAFHAGIDLKERIISDKEIKSRIFYWRAAIDLALQHRVLGLGYAMFDPHFWDYTLEQQDTEAGPFYYDVLPAISGRTPGHVHNEYLEVLAEQGFAGFIPLAALLVFFLFFCYFGIMARDDPRAAMQSVAVYGSFVTILIDAMFAFPWRLPVSLIVFMVVIAWLYETIYPSDGPDPVASGPAQD
jgi:O-antigen ligase